VETLAEADDPESGEGAREALGPHLDPVDIGDLFPRCSALGLGQHSGIRVESDDALEEMGEQQSDGAWSATDVEEAPPTVEVEVLGESIGQRRSIWFTTLAVVRGGALEYGLVPDPVLPPMGRWSLRHVLSVADLSWTRPALVGRRRSVGGRVAVWCRSAAPPLPPKTPAIVWPGSMDIERSRRFYTEVLGGRVAFSGEVTYVALANSWIIINVGGGPTDDKPAVTLETPRDPDRVSSCLNIRVKDIQAVYAEWSARGAHFLTPPKQHQYEIRCYIRDPDGHLIEVGQTTDPEGDWSAWLASPSVS
jgi:catechol 2,3-dioxygenase-like lactoylglutathione lyase family enzyme